MRLVAGISTAHSTWNQLSLAFTFFVFSLLLSSGYYIDNSSCILFFRVQSLSAIYLQRAQVHAETSVLKKTPSAQ